MKKGIIYFVCTLFVLITSCSNEKSARGINVETESIKASVLKMNSHELMGVEHVIIDRDYMITAHRGTDSLMKVFERSTGEFLGDIASIGYGPTEYTGVEYRTIDSANDGLVFMEASSNQIINMNIASESGMLVSAKSKVTQIPLNTQFTNEMIVFGDSLVIGHSNSDLMNTQLFTYDMQTDEIHEFLDYPEDLPVKLTSPAEYELYFKKLVAHPTEDKFAVLYNKFDKVYIYDTKLNLKNESGSLDARRIVKNNGDIYHEKAYNFNLSVVTTDKHIIGLYTGKTNLEMKMIPVNKMMDLKTKAIIWDWEGNMVKEVIFDRTISHIATDNERKALIGLSPYIADEIYIYDLAELF